MVIKVILLRHLKNQAKERNIDMELIKETLLNPEQIVPELTGLKIAHKKYFDKHKNKIYLIRVIFKEEKDLRIGVTVYKTSKIKKYLK